MTAHAASKGLKCVSMTGHIDAVGPRACAGHASLEIAALAYWLVGERGRQVGRSSRCWRLIQADRGAIVIKCETYSGPGRSKPLGVLSVTRNRLWCRRDRRRGGSSATNAARPLVSRRGWIAVLAVC